MPTDSPSATRMDSTIPSTGEEMSRTDLSDSTSAIRWPARTSSPGWISQAMTVTDWSAGLAPFASITKSSADSLRGNLPVHLEIQHLGRGFQDPPGRRKHVELIREIARNIGVRTSDPPAGDVAARRLGDCGDHLGPEAACQIVFVDHDDLAGAPRRFADGLLDPRARSSEGRSNPRRNQLRRGTRRLARRGGRSSPT